MKKLLFAVFTTVALLGLATAFVWAAPVSQNNKFPDLAVTISGIPDTVSPNDEMEFIITYKNQGEANVPEGANISFSLFLTKASDPDQKAIDEPLKKEIPGAAGLQVDKSKNITETLTMPGAEGAYTVVIVLDTGNVENEEGQRNNTVTKTFEVKSALPPGVAQLLAGLGMFAAIMAIMAAGTEVIIDTIKVFVGMKQKVTALETLNELKKELPGQLSSLGVDDKSLGEVDKLLKNIKITVKPVAEAGKIPEHVRNGDFGKVFKVITPLLPTVIQDANASLQGLKTATKAEIDTVISNLGLGANVNLKRNLETLIDNVTLENFAELPKKIRNALQADNAKDFEEDFIKVIEDLSSEVIKQVSQNVDFVKLKDTVKSEISEAALKLQKRLHLGNEITDPIEKSLANFIDNVKAEDIVALPKLILTTLQEQATPLTEKWLNAQTNTLFKQGKTKVMDHLGKDVIPTLQALGVGDEDIKTARAKLEETLNYAADLIPGATGAYTQAVRNLLKAIEERRNEMQSPLRKIYRRLRNSQNLSFWGIFWGIVAVILLIIFIFWSDFFVSTSPMRLIGLLFAGLIGWGLNWAIMQHRPNPLKLGDALRWIETHYNTVRGNTEAPENYGKVDSKVLGKIENMGTTTVAGVLFEREDKHQDEETSRLRFLRVISIIVGITLAYLLEVDAAELLNFAVPNISGKLNSVNLHNDLSRVIPEKLTIGIILTGLAASAGSKFWRDILSRLQSTKTQAEESAKLVRQMKGTIGSIETNK